MLTTFDDEALLFDHKRAEQTAERLAGEGVREFVVKCGAAPALAVSQGTQLRIPALANVEVCNTTAAGDSFNGGYVAARIVGKSVEEATWKGHRVAAIAVSRFGALAPMQALRGEALR